MIEVFHIFEYLKIMGWKCRVGEKRKMVSDVHASELVNVFTPFWMVFLFDINPHVVLCI